MIHALTLLLIVVFFAPLVSMIPLAGLSAVLMMVAWNMSEVHHFRRIFKAPAGDVAVLLTTFFLTVIFDLVLAIEVGMILAAFLFMKRVRDLSGVHALQFIDEDEEVNNDPDAIQKKRVPAGVQVYEINGLYLVGLAESLNSILSNFETAPRVFILRMRKLPVIDASGMHGLMEFYEKCHRRGTVLILSGVNPSVNDSLRKYGLVELIGADNILDHIDPALDRAHLLLEVR
jgi:SulP family sulfate permease